MPVKRKKKDPPPAELEAEEEFEEEIEEDLRPARGYVISEGRAITSLRGVLGEGSPVTEDDFSGGKETLAELIKRGFVVEK